MATHHPDIALGFEDDVWWSREAQPHMHAWSDEKPVRLVEKTVPAKDPAGKALACYGLYVPTTHRMLWRFVQGRPLSVVTCAFLAWLATYFTAQGKRALGLMRKARVAVQRPRRRGPMTTDSRHGYEVAPTLLARQFDVTAPDHVWAGAITSRWMAEGWLYRSVLVALYARTVVGWAMSHPMETPFGDTLSAGRVAEGARTSRSLGGVNAPFGPWQSIRQPRLPSHHREHECEGRMSRPCGG